jgi:hypothetical protein
VNNVVVLLVFIGSLITDYLAGNLPFFFPPIQTSTQYCKRAVLPVNTAHSISRHFIPSTARQDTQQQSAFVDYDSVLLRATFLLTLSVKYA